MFRLTILCFIFFTVVLGAEVDVESSSNGKVVVEQMVEVSAVSKGNNSDLLFAGDNESQMIDIDSVFNYSINDNDSLNESSRSPSKSLKVGSWMILGCGSDKFSWMCEMERHLVISDLDFWDTFRFVVGGDKLQIGCVSEKPANPTPEPENNFHLRIFLQCPSACNDSCSSSSLYFASFWLGLMIGLMVGIILVAMLASSVSASISDDKTKNQIN